MPAPLNVPLSIIDEVVNESQLTLSLGPQNMSALGHSSMLFSPNKAAAAATGENFVMRSQADEIVEERGGVETQISVEEIDNDDVKGLLAKSKRDKNGKLVLSQHEQQR